MNLTFRTNVEASLLLEVVFALAQGLNLDDTELAYVVLNSNF